MQNGGLVCCRCWYHISEMLGWGNLKKIRMVDFFKLDYCSLLFNKWEKKRHWFCVDMFQLALNSLKQILLCWSENERENDDNLIVTFTFQFLICYFLKFELASYCYLFPSVFTHWMIYSLWCYIQVAPVMKEKNCRVVS